MGQHPDDQPFLKIIKGGYLLAWLLTVYEEGINGLKSSYSARDQAWETLENNDDVSGKRLDLRSLFCRIRMKSYWCWFRRQMGPCYWMVVVL